MRRLYLAVSLFVLSVGIAAASPALTSGASYMRSGPGSKYRVVQTIPANAQIDINYCQAAWCYASWRNLTGYITASVVQSLPPPPPPVYVGPVAPPWWGPGWGWGYGPGYYGPGPGYYRGPGYFGGGRFRR